MKLKTQKRTRVSGRLLIAYDGKAWYVRRIHSIGYDVDLDRKIYVCDKPLANDLPTLADAVKFLERRTRQAGRNKHGK